MAPDLSILVHDLHASGVVRNALRIAGAAQAAGMLTEIWVARREGALRHAVPEGVALSGGGRDGKPAGRTRDLALSIAPLRAHLAERRPRIALSAGNHMHFAASLAHRTHGHTALWARASNATLRAPVAGYLGAPLPAILARGVDLINSLQYRRFDRVIAVSEELADALVRDLGVAAERVSTIPNGVDVDDIARRSAEAAADPGTPRGPDPVVLSAGRLSRQKNFVDLIRAVALARQTRPLHLVILGDGPARERQALERLAAELGISSHVTLAGYVANPYPHMAKASVFAVSSLWEGASNVVIEALAAGCPVVGYRCPTGIAEVLPPERQVVPGDIAGLAQVILQELAKPRDSAACRAMASRYSLAACLSAYVELFKTALL